MTNRERRYIKMKRTIAIKFVGSEFKIPVDNYRTASFLGNHPNNVTMKDVTTSDVREWAKQLEAAGIKDRYAGQEVKVESISETHYKITGHGTYGIIKKESWNDALMKAVGIKK